MPSSLKQMYAKYPSFRFVAVGAANVSITYLAYLIAIQFMDYRSAYWIAVILGLIIMSIMNIWHSFNHKLSLISICVYGSYYYGYSLAHVALITKLVEDFSLWKEIAPLGSIAILIFPHYFISKHLVHKVARPRGEASPTNEQQDGGEPGHSV